jgi:hypothetical protein
MKIKLTTCFYENPAAKAEIKFWETQVEDRIESKMYIDDYWSYILKRNDGSKEFMFCFPTNLIQYHSVRGLQNLIDNYLQTHLPKEKYETFHYKTLTFGRLEKEYLEFYRKWMNHCI